MPLKLVSTYADSRTIAVQYWTVLKRNSATPADMRGRSAMACVRRRAQITFFAPFIFHPQDSLTTAPRLDKCREGSLYLSAICDVVTKQLCLVAVRIFKEFERGVVFQLGRLVSFRGPGLSFIIPFIEKMVRGDLPTLTLNVSPQDAITRDNVNETIIVPIPIDPLASIMKPTTQV